VTTGSPIREYCSVASAPLWDCGSGRERQDERDNGPACRARAEGEEMTATRTQKVVEGVRLGKKPV
jgi:hypothetical protein